MKLLLNSGPTGNLEETSAAGPVTITMCKVIISGGFIGVLHEQIIEPCCSELLPEKIQQFD